VIKIKIAVSKVKKLHLICNAHLDPIWQWDWQEGASAALATFRSAVDLADEYDYIFCHNEVTLYKYIEEYAPALFARIQELVKLGKWVIIGGWYLQPDCNMPSGESLVRQILYGRKYFEERFGVKPTEGISFDAFGHSGGLPQIMKKCGQESYIIMRPHPSELPLNDNFFVWEGVDGSKVKVARCKSYNTLMGHARESIEEYIKEDNEREVGLRLWGVGNHGGGPSRKDLQDIANLQVEAQKDGLEIVHSTPTQFFSEAEFKGYHKGSLVSCMPGCYTSLSTLKRKHAELENEYYLTELICSCAEKQGGIAYPTDVLNIALEDLLNMEFHDVLPGTVVKNGERNGLLLADHALLELERLKTRAFFSLVNCKNRAAEGEYPVFVFNAQPYERETEIEVEFSLADQNWDLEKPTLAEVFDEEGNLLVSQHIKEESTFNLDWRKKVIFTGKLHPLGVTRFSIYLKTGKPAEKRKTFHFEGKYVRAEIGEESGWIEKLEICGQKMENSGFGCLSSWKDNADPWAMSREQLKGIGCDPEQFRLMKNPHGVFEGMQPISVIEDGDIVYAVEAFFECGDTVARNEYVFYKNRPYFDIKTTLFMQNADRIVRIEFPTPIKGDYFGQAAYGAENLYMDGRECVAQRYVGVRNDKDCFVILNRGVYGSRFEKNTIFHSLIRGAGYCVHPIADRELIPEKRYIKRMDQCEHLFEFRIAICGEEEVERISQEFNRKAYALNVFPIAEGKDNGKFDIEISDDNILLTVLKKGDKNGYIVRLFNGSQKDKSCTVRIGAQTLNLMFSRYEVKTLKALEDSLCEVEMEI